MADFKQNGIIATLHKLRERPIEDLEAELSGFAKKNPMALILPSLYSELDGPALSRIIDDLCLVPYIDHIIVGLDRADEAEYKRAREFFARLPQRTTLLWNDGPRLQALNALLDEQRLAPGQRGKGCNAWYCFGYALALDEAEAIALHDCDIVTYDRHLPARLFYPVANPAFDYRFCKGYYARLTEDSMGGRATRLFVVPLIKSLKRILGNSNYLEYLDSFRYPLSGEFALKKDELKSLRIPSDWGLEIGVLSEVYRNIALQHVCQVDIADRYDHKHQPMSRNEGEGLGRMAVEIAKSIYRKLATEGVLMTRGLFRTLKATYYRTALDMLQQYVCDAQINGYVVDVHAEEQAIELFTGAIINAGDHYLANPMEVPFIPNWNRVFSAVPDFSEQFIAAVAADNA